MMYKAVLAAIPAVGAIASTGAITPTVAGIIVGVLGWLGSLLADRGSSQLQKDGTLVLTGSVPEQVSKGLDILVNQTVSTIDQISEIGKGVNRLQDVKDDLVRSLDGVPLGPLAQQAIQSLPKL
jgi:hypothetical protein